MVFKQKIGAVVGAAALLLGAACTQDLTVTNLEEPDIARALATPNDVQTLVGSALTDWYNTSTAIDPWCMLNVTADASTANFGNFGMRFNNLEPRIEYHNQSADGDAGVANNPWNDNYAALGEANDALRAIKGGIVFSGGQALTDQYATVAKFAQAGVLTNLALIYDKAFVVDENTDLANAASLQMQPYTEVAKAAQASWDAVIAATNGKTYQFPSQPIPLDGQLFTAKTINRFANTMNALLLAYTPRNAADAAKVDWAKVLQYADKGIGTGSAGAPFNFSVIGDNNIWVSGWLYYADEPSWLRVDMNVIHQMDPSVPAKYTGSSTNVPPSGNGDARLGAKGSGADFEYLGTVIGDPGRGIWMQSPYAHQRYKYYARTSTPTNGKGPAPYVLAAESDLVKAEALVRTNGDLNLAASLINNTRVTRGKLPPVAASDGSAKLLAAITYERLVETFATDGFTFFQLRHVDALQPGTLHHLPVPAAELETLSLPIYTFGGPQPLENYLPTGGSALNVRFPSGRAASGHAATPFMR